MEKEEKVVPEYEHPEVKDYGDLQELTNASVSGSFTDVPFSIHTHIDDLTFS